MLCLPPFRQEEAQDIGEGRDLAGADDAVDVPDGGHVCGAEARRDMVGIRVEGDGVVSLVVTPKNRGSETGAQIKWAWRLAGVQGCRPARSVA